MNADIVKQMRQEEADLLRKLKAVRDFLSVYGETPKGSVADVSGNSSRKSGAREKVEIASFNEQTRTSVVLAMRALSETQGLVKTSELVKYVEQTGHTITGQNKVNALGALLARSVDIISHGKSGWSLADQGRAMEIIDRYAPKENEPHSETAGGSDAGAEGVGAPTYPWRSPHLTPTG